MVCSSCSRGVRTVSTRGRARHLYVVRPSRQLQPAHQPHVRWPGSLRVLLGSVELGTSVRPLIISLRVGFCSANAASRSCALPFGLAPKVPVCASQVQGSAVFHEASVLAVNGGRTVLHNAHSGALWPSERQPAEAALNDGYRSKCGTISQTPLIQNSSA